MAVYSVSIQIVATGHLIPAHHTGFVFSIVIRINTRIILGLHQPEIGAPLNTQRIMYLWGKDAG